MFIGAAATIFASGWQVNGWRLDAKHVDAMQKLTTELQQRLESQAALTRQANERLFLRETQLLKELDAARVDNALLTEEIENADIVTVTERVEVPADCPPVPQCAVVDSLRYRALYNRAATGALPDPGAGDSPVP